MGFCSVGKVGGDLGLVASTLAPLTSRLFAGRPILLLLRSQIQTDILLKNKNRKIPALYRVYPLTVPVGPRTLNGVSKADRWGPAVVLVCMRGISSQYQGFVSLAHGRRVHNSGAAPS